MRLTRLTLAWVLITVLTLSAPKAMAYIGPGAGAGLIATVLGVIAAILLALIGTIYYPLKRFLNNRKSRIDQKDDGNETRR